MAQPSKYRSIRREDIPEAPGWFDKVISVLTSFMTDTTDALTGRLTRADNFLSKSVPLTFTTAASAADTFPLTFQNKLPVKPTGAWIGQLYKKNGSAMTGPYSCSWVLDTKGQILLSLNGLENSTDYVGTLIYEA